MQSVEAEGDSIDAAIDAALKVLGTTRDRVEIEILANASRGLFGIGGRKARVRATVRAPISADADERPAPRVSAPRGADCAAAARRRRVPSRRRRRRRRFGPPGRRRRTMALASGRQRFSRRSSATSGSRPASSCASEDEHVLLELTGDSSGVLIGRRGQMLDALEYLINRIVGRDEGASRLLVDSQNYRARRRTSLEEMARRMGEQAKRKGKPVTLNPMSPHDRRIVHLVLQEDPTLTTKSSGKGYFRRLIIIPGRAPATRRTGVQSRSSW